MFLNFPPLASLMKYVSVTVYITNIHGQIQGFTAETSKIGIGTSETRIAWSPKTGQAGSRSWLLLGPASKYESTVTGTLLSASSV